MSVVKINAIEVPPGAGPELEKRFAARAGMVEQAPGFEEFCLLRPAPPPVDEPAAGAAETRYFVYTRWASEQDYQAWFTQGARSAHAPSGRQPVAARAQLLAFEVVTRTVAEP